MINSVTRWLDQTAEKYPDRIALVDEEHTYTFRQVRQMAMSAACFIREAVSMPRRPVAVLQKKSADVLITYFGIAYSGNCYSPIAADMPAGRVHKILDTLQPALMICDDENAGRCGSGREIAYTGKSLVFSEITGRTDPEAEQSVLAWEDEILDTDLLYILFTSGSTGSPKGVAIPHKAVIDFTDWMTDTFRITCDDRMGNQAPFYFDLSVLDVYAPIKTGASLYIIPGGLFAQPVRLLSYIREKKLSILFWVPSALMMLSKLRAFEEVDVSRHLRTVLFCGEVMPNKQLNIWRHYLPDVTYANLYGPTEATDASTCYIVDREFSDDEPLPIGRAMRNTQVLVLREDDTPVQGEENGELCIRGTGLAAGYYNDPEKTAASFVQNPLNRAVPDIIYRTGDIVHYNERGELVYVCRKDFQIKHMGHRIELGEIETAASSLEGVDNCCCLYDTKRSRILLVLETKDESLDKKTVNERLREMVPEYMLPGKVLMKAQFPYNMNGKVDRKQLRAELIGD